jgi:hypothetical protein
LVGSSISDRPKNVMATKAHWKGYSKVTVRDVPSTALEQAHAAVTRR